MAEDIRLVNALDNNNSNSLLIQYRDIRLHQEFLQRCVPKQDLKSSVSHQGFDSGFYKEEIQNF